MGNNDILIEEINQQPSKSIILWQTLRNTVPAANPYAKLSDGYVSTLWHKGEPSVGSDGMFVALDKLHTIDEAIMQDLLCLKRMDLLTSMQNRNAVVQNSLLEPKYKNYLNYSIQQAVTDHAIVAHAGNNAVHLDPYEGNIVTYNSFPCLIDLDTLSIGPWQYDYIVYLVSSILFGGEIQVSKIPTEVLAWEHYDRAVRLRKTDMFSWVCYTAIHSEPHYEEMIKRYETLIGNSAYIWNKSL